MIQSDTKGPSVPLRLALQTSDLDTIWAYAESSVRAVSRRWYSNGYINTQMSLGDLSQELRVRLFEKVIPNFNKDGRYDNEILYTDRDLQRIFGRYTLVTLENFLRDFVKKYTRNPDRFLIDGMPSIESACHASPVFPGDNGGGTIDEMLNEDGTATMSGLVSTDEPTVDLAHESDLLRSIANDLDKDAAAVAQCTVDGMNAVEAAEYTGLKPYRVRRILNDTVRPYIRKITG